MHSSSFFVVKKFCSLFEIDYLVLNPRLRETICLFVMEHLLLSYGVLICWNITELTEKAYTITIWPPHSEVHPITDCAILRIRGNNGNDGYFIEIVNSQLRVTATIGRNKVDLKLGRGLSSGDMKWHEVTVTRRGRSVTMVLDNQDKSGDIPRSGGQMSINSQ